MAVKLVARVDVRDMHLEDRPFEDLHCVEYRYRRERIGGRIDDQRVGFRARRLDQVDQNALMVRLMERELRAREISELLATGLDRIERRRSVDMRLSNPQHVQIGAIDDHDAHEKSLLFFLIDIDWIEPCLRGKPDLSIRGAEAPVSAASLDDFKEETIGERMRVELKIFRLAFALVKDVQ